MKNIITGFFLMSALLFTLASCDEEYITYGGPNYIMFSDTLYTFPVENNEDYFEIPVSATQACDYDRTLAVEIIDSKSNAIEGKHYKLESNTVTIKAGELATKVRVRGYHDNIAVEDSLGFAMRLIAPADTQWELYGIDTNVLLQKACTFDINTFTGYCQITFSTWMYYYMSDIDTRLTKSKVDPENENTIIIEDFFYDGYDARIKFNTEDILEPIIEFDEQAFASTADAFGTTYGDGELWMYQPTAYTSYYSSCEQFVLQYMTLYVPGMSGSNVVGTFVNVIKWISDDEAEKLKREGY